MDNNQHTILIAEDVESNFLYLKAIFRKLNYHLIWAKNGEEAVTYFCSNNDIELILMDLQMPVMNGLEATKIIRKQNKTIPIIVQTAFVLGSDIDEAKAAGCNDYISKPIKGEELIQKVENLLVLNTH